METYGVKWESCLHLGQYNGKLFTGAEGQVYSSSDQGKTCITVVRGWPIAKWQIIGRTKSRKIYVQN